MPTRHATFAASATFLMVSRSDLVTPVVAVLVPVVAAFVAAFLARVEVQDGQLCLTTLGIRRRRIYLFGLRSVTTRTVRWHPAPTLVLVGLDGTRLAIRLGSWHREDELVALIAGAADRAHANVDARGGDILSRRPTAETWLPSRKPMSIRGGEQLTKGRFLVLATVLGVGLVAVYGGSQVARQAGNFVGGIWETVVFPKHPDPIWVDRSDVPTGPAFTWGGNVVDTDGHIALVTEEDFEASQGIAKVRTSDDGGRTWSQPVAVSGRRTATGETLVAAPDGTLTIAWSQAAQLLVVRRSRDGGRSWSASSAVTPANGGLAFLPALVTTDTLVVMAYTDAFGDIYAQPLTRDGAPDGDPARVSAHRSGGDLPVGDSLLGIAATGSRVAIAYVRAENALEVAFSDDGGRHWRDSSPGQFVYGGHPRLASDGSTLVLAVTDPGTPEWRSRRRLGPPLQRPHVAIQVSHDGGATWQPTKQFEDAPDVGPLELAHSGGMWRLLYVACPGDNSCVTQRRMWYTASRDGQDWTDPIVVTDPGLVMPIGIAADASGVSAVWATLAEDQTFRLFVSRQHG